MLTIKQASDLCESEGIEPLKTIIYEMRAFISERVMRKNTKKKLGPNLGLCSVLLGRIYANADVITFCVPTISTCPQGMNAFLVKSLCLGQSK